MKIKIEDTDKPGIVVGARGAAADELDAFFEEVAASRASMPANKKPLQKEAGQVYGNTVGDEGKNEHFEGFGAVRARK